MIDISKCINSFFEYVKNYDLSDTNILRKKLHSFRVMQLSSLIAQSLNLTFEECCVATIIGLLHDIARFKQYKEYHTYNDRKSFDHGDMGAKILENDLKNYVDEYTYDKYKDVIISAVKNHNKFQIEDNLNQTQKMFSNIVRDADKLDILYELTCIFFKGEEKSIKEQEILDSVYEDFLRKNSIRKLENVEYSYVDRIVIYLAFVFDLNFRESYNILKENNIIDKVISRFEYNTVTKERMITIQNLANEYIEEKLKR